MRPPSAWAVLSVSRAALFAPRQIGARLANASRAALIAALLADTLAAIAAMLAVAIQAETVSFRFVQTSQPTLSLDLRSYRAAAISLWDSGGVLGISLITTLLLIATAVGVTIAHAPRVDRGGPLADTLRRGLAATVGGLPLLILLAFILGMGTSLAGNASILASQSGAPPPDWAFEMLPVLVVASLYGWLWHQGQVADGVSLPLPPIAPTPHCELCGYDLTGQPADSHCPECGRAARYSLEAAHRGPSAFEQNPTGGALWRDSFALILRPAQFYAQREARSEEEPRVRGFANWHRLALGIVACVLFSFTEAPITAVPVLAGFFVLGLWGIARVACGVGTLIWALRGVRREPRWLRRLPDFEMAFGWVTGGALATLVASLIVFGPWPSDLIGLRRILAPFGLVPEPIVIGLILLALGFVQLWRIGVAGRALRFANR